MNTKEKIEKLREEIRVHNRHYYDNDAAVISDFEYDALMRELKDLEEKNPELITADSPTQKVGGTLKNTFAEVRHAVPLESLNDVFSFEELFAFEDRVKNAIDEDINFCVEPKIDGLSVSLIYENGIFIQGATRGDGTTGEDVTENLKTVRSLPKKLNNTADRLIVRGEIYMSKEVFLEINAKREENGEKLMANPRNAAAGSMRQKDPKIAAERKLDLVVFNVQLAEGVDFVNHSESLDYLKSCGFQVVDYSLCKNVAECTAVIDNIDKKRNEMPFELDGAVIKLNNLAQREDLGSTAKAPRWAAAYKYPPEEKETLVKDIVIQVGRTGVLTPKVVVEAVALAGTSVTNASLHNQDFIDKLDIRIGDTVIMRKAGEIIPEVLAVVKEKRPENTAPYKIPEFCPACGAKVEKDNDEAAMRCTSPECPAQLVRNIAHFASRDAMDIEGFGVSTVEALIKADLIKSPADIFYLQKDEIANLDRMGEVSATNLINAIEKSKSAGLARLLFAFGIRQIGQKAAKTFADYFGTLDKLMQASLEDLVAVPDVGEITAQFLLNWFSMEQSRHQIKLMREAGVLMENIDTNVDKRFSGMTFVLTGTLSLFKRDEAAKMIEERAGKVSGSVSKKTTYVVAGENAGSKLKKAEDLNIKVLSEEEFQDMIN